MKSKTKNRLQSAGWTIGDAADFLELSAEEAAYIELKLALSKKLKIVRKASGLTQAQVANLISSSQSRVAKMESGDSTVSLDLLIKTLLALGTSPKEVGKTISQAA